MNSFKILLNFSLEKRIKNKTFIIVNLLMFIVIACIMFSDVYIKDIFPDLFEKPIVYVQDDNLYKFFNDYLEGQFVVKYTNSESQVIDKDRKYLIEDNECYDITIYENENELELSIIQNALLQYQQVINYSTLIMEGKLLNKEIYVHRVINNEDEQKAPWGFIVVTSIYFFAMSFASIVANDVVYEKSTKMMEMILTSTSASVHLLAKLCAGWFMVIAQILIVFIEIIFLSIIRYMFDGFKGFIKMINELGYIEGDADINIKYLIDFIQDNYEYIILIVFSVLIMFLGILLIQTVLVILSSFISNIEEAGNIQSPFYLLLLSVYYLNLFLDNTQSMTNGMGKTLSMIPFFSMLFMPCRLLCYNVPYIEVLYSIANSFITLILVLFIGSGIYKKGVLDYSSGTLLSKFIRNR